MGMNAQQIAATVNAGRGADGLFSEGDAIKQLSDRQQQVMDRIHDLQRRMEPHWEGNAADAAYAGAGPLIEASKVASDQMCKAGTLYQEQGGNFNSLKAKVGDGPGPKPEPDPEPITSFTGGGISNEAQINAWDEEAQKVVQAYNAYADHSGTNAASWPADYGTLGLPQGGADFTVDMGAAGGSGSGSGSSYGPTAGGPGGYAGAPGAVAPVPGSGGGSSYPSVPAASDTSTGAAGYTDPNVPPGYAGGGYGSPGYGAGSGYGQGSGHGQGPGGAYPYGHGQRGSSGSSGSGFGPRGSASYGSGGYGSGGYGARAGSGFGPTGGGAGAGAGNDTQSPGRSSGVGAAPREAAGPVRGASAAAGSAGSSAPGRAAPMGMGGAGRGQGGEDETHERPTYLEENDVDSIFGPDPDDKTVPPVIGL